MQHDMQLITYLFQVDASNEVFLNSYQSIYKLHALFVRRLRRVFGYSPRSLSFLQRIYNGTELLASCDRFGTKWGVFFVLGIDLYLIWVFVFSHCKKEGFQKERDGEKQQGFENNRQILLLELFLGGVFNFNNF